MSKLFETAKNFQQDVFNRFVELVFPPQCAGCESSMESQKDLAWCEACLTQFRSDPEKCCPKCGAEKRQNVFRDGRCELCRDLPIAFDRAISIGNYYGLMQELVTNMKAVYSEPLALQFGMLLGKEILFRHKDYACDWIVAVPAYWSRRIRRPCHLAGVIAEGVSRVLRFPVLPNAIQCTRKTKKQGTLDTPGRLENVKGAFDVMDVDRFREKRILVVDDVMTSGATINQVAKVLKKSGALEVVVATVARGARLS